MNVDLARIQFASTSIYHFLFVPVTIGLSFLVAVLQTMWHRSRDPEHRRLTKFFGTLLVINVAIGVAGLEPLKDYRGVPDTEGRVLQATMLAVADELASAAELVMGKVDRIPVAVIRGYSYTTGEGTARQLLRAPEKDLFR